MLLTCFCDLDGNQVHGVLKLLFVASAAMAASWLPCLQCASPHSFIASGLSPVSPGFALVMIILKGKRLCSIGSLFDGFVF